MKRYANEARIQLWCCEVLGQLMQLNCSTQGRCGQEGVVGALMKTLARHLKDESVTETSLHTLCMAIYRHSDNKADLIATRLDGEDAKDQDDGIGLIEAAMA